MIKTTHYYLRDAWDMPDGTAKWAYRSEYEFATKRAATIEARKLARSIGKGARVQVMAVTIEVAAEVTA